MNWRAGDAVVVRSILPSDSGPRVGAVRSFTVVEDREDLLALYIGPGYPCKRRVGVRGGPRGRVMLADTGRHEDRVWASNHVLLLYRPGDAHSTQLFRRAADGAFLGWYIDLSEPLRRTPSGFDTRDHVLDVEVAPDRATWAWKDEDELAWRLENGMLAAEDARAIRVEGERAVARLTGTGLYREWEDWRPDPSWPVPAIPDGWNVVV